MNKIYWILIGYVFVGILWVKLVLLYNPPGYIGFTIWMTIRFFTNEVVVKYIYKVVARDKRKGEKSD